jgi:hypothetical protein
MVWMRFTMMLSRCKLSRRISATLPSVQSLVQVGGAFLRTYGVAAPSEAKATRPMDRTIRVVNSSNSRPAVKAEKSPTPHGASAQATAATSHRAAISGSAASEPHPGNARLHPAPFAEDDGPEPAGDAAVDGRRSQNTPGHRWHSMCFVVSVRERSQRVE